MNALNAVLFGMTGSAMQALPHLKPDWFPASAPDQASTSGLWMAFMGLVLAWIGVSHLVRTIAVPALLRVMAIVRPDETAAAALPAARGIAGR